MLNIIFDRGLLEVTTILEHERHNFDLYELVLNLVESMCWFFLQPVFWTTDSKNMNSSVVCYHIVIIFDLCGLSFPLVVNPVLLLRHMPPLPFL